MRAFASSQRRSRSAASSWSSERAAARAAASTWATRAGEARRGVAQRHLGVQSRWRATLVSVSRRSPSSRPAAARSSARDGLGELVALLVQLGEDASQIGPVESHVRQLLADLLGAGEGG